MQPWMQAQQASQASQAATQAALHASQQAAAAAHRSTQFTHHQARRAAMSNANYRGGGFIRGLFKLIGFLITLAIFAAVVIVGGAIVMDRWPG